MESFAAGGVSHPLRVAARRVVKLGPRWRKARVAWDTPGRLGEEVTCG